MNLTNFLQRLIIQGWKFWNDKDKLLYDAPKEKLTLDTLNQLKEYKSDILRLLRESPEIFQIDSALTLTSEQIEHFNNKGWLGPLDAFSLSEIRAVMDCLESHSVVPRIHKRSTMVFHNNIYNQSTSRDQHLFHRPIAELFKSPKIVQRLNNLGEPDLLLWRTNLFAKLAGHDTISWHQVFEHYSTTNIHEAKQSLIFPEKDKDALNFTVWVALDDSTIDNGCLQFANGTHKVRFEFVNNSVPASEGIFAGINIHHSLYQQGNQYSGTFIFDENDWEIEAVPAKAGQIIIFSERCMHSSLPNQTNNRRLAINARYIRPSVHIYPHRWKGDFIDENNHNIEKQFSILVSGKDDYKVNVVQDWNDLNEVEVEFQKMFNLLKFMHVKTPMNDEFYKINSLYKQAIEGDCQESQPKKDSAKYPLWEAWKRKSGMSKLVAMKEYSKLVASLPRKVVRKH
ncbi:conserved hypothetical protein [Hyella patelloides LEGE 07179]|uniref:ACB domain-containing protein n=1 Tax=Hyella patelloides LEGE 07179 TaxID=945734 RepID=A0A563VQT0_9CYAN|nr:acyl-CoA-binding protein [Hyella patelloides]VEP13754.1 conserved hypothetical protein [Hyella patelloides LEGE 07179]